MTKFHQKGFILPLIIIIIGLAVLGTAGYFVYRQYTSPQEPVACTQDAKQCPDGTYVGRIGPNCEFATCPEPNELQGEKLITLTYGKDKEEIFDISSGGEIDVNLVYPAGKMSAELYTECPSGVSGNGIKYASWSDEICSQYLDATYGGGYNFEFRNSTNQVQTVKMTYNVSTSDGKNYSQTVQFTVQPENK